MFSINSPSSPFNGVSGGSGKNACGGGALGLTSDMLVLLGDTIAERGVLEKRT